MESIFTPHLHTNYVPSDVEVEQIRKHISRPLEERSRLEERITRFQAILDDLRAQHDKLDAHIQDHLALTSGARRLPHDVVREIFCHCLPADRNAVMSATEPPLLLGHICSGWRKIALSTPDLWATLHIPIPYRRDPFHYNKWSQIVEAVKTWLDLSRGLPLSISAAWSSVPGVPLVRQTSLSMTYFMNILIRHSRRWEHIDFKFPLPELTTALALLTEADVPLLKSVILESTVFDDVVLTDQWPPSIGFLTTPTLREVSIISFKHTAYIQPPPWAQLTGLYLDSGIGPWDSGLAETDILNILKQCSMLEQCKLFVDSNPTSPPQPALQEVTLPFLHSLIFVEGTETALTSQFIDCLKVPILKYLGFRRPGNSSVRELPLSLIRIFTGENRIEELELGLEAMLHSNLRECFHRAKHIKRLTLHSPERLWGYWPTDTLPSNHILQLLTNEELLCPLLEEITFMSCRELPDEKILSFLQERTAPINTGAGAAILKRATFTLNREMTIDIMPDAQPLVAAGLKLDLKYIPPILELDPDSVVAVPNGPKLKVSYVTSVPEQFFSPFRGLRTKKLVNSLM